MQEILKAQRAASSAHFGSNSGINLTVFQRGHWMLLSNSTETGHENGDDASVLKLFPCHMHACALAPDSVGSLKYHGIMECFEWEDHPVPPPYHNQGHFTLAQIAPNAIHSGLGHFQGYRGSHNFSGQLHQVPEEFPPNIPS